MFCCLMQLFYCFKWHLFSYSSYSILGTALCDRLCEKGVLQTSITHLKKKKAKNSDRQYILFLGWGTT